MSCRSCAPLHPAAVVQPGRQAGRQAASAATAAASTPVSSGLPPGGRWCGAAEGRVPSSVFRTMHEPRWYIHLQSPRQSAAQRDSCVYIDQRCAAVISVERDVAVLEGWSHRVNPSLLTAQRLSFINNTFHRLFFEAFQLYTRHIYASHEMYFISLRAAISNININHN